MLEEKLEETMAHWTQRLATVFKEGFNSLFSVVKCEACGSRPVEHMTAKLSFVAKEFTPLRYCFSENSGLPQPY